MSIGIGQILVILLLVIFLFGKFPNLSKNFTDGLVNIRNVLEQKKEITSDNMSKKDDINNTEKK
jgi:Sec-independent protein translocase protein TatA|uniref:Sec-independent protein translocase component tatA/E n=1 Tax=Reclinomonas americana ATCC 50283 TaxID=1295594 RepID=M4QCX5_RECAM|nr:Sec-independent protein translocase component tatA/E [Reclinomonas americana ATCC 50283]